MWLLLLFILIPLLEIWLFILLGGFIGIYPTLFVILLTAILGTFLVKTQGINVLKEIQSKFNELGRWIPIESNYKRYSFEEVEKNINNI